MKKRTRDPKMIRVNLGKGRYIVYFVTLNDLFKKK